MGISGVTSALASNLSALYQGSASGGTGSASGGSRFGPAYVLGGSTPMAGAGTYSALGAASPPPSEAERRREQTLQAIAASIDRGDTARGRAMAETLLTKNASDVTAIRLVGYAYMKEANYRDAERYFLKAAGLAPGSSSIQRDLSDARLLQEDDATVLATARRKIKSPSQRVNGLRLLVRLTNRSPDKTEAYLALADGYDAAAKPLYVVGALQEALRHADSGEIEQVISRAEKLVRSHGEVGIVHNLLGRALQKAGRHTDALGELEAAVDLAPYNFSYRTDLAAAYVDRANLRLSRGDTTNAEVDLHTAQRLSPTDPGMREALSRVAADHAERDLSGARLTSAVTNLRKATLTAPADVAFKRRLASLYVRAGGYYEAQNADSTALTAYIEAHQLDPTSSVTKRKVGELSHEKGLANLTTKNYDAAIIHFARAYTTDRGVDTYRTALANAYDVRGQFHQSQSDHDDAITDFERGLALDPTNTSLGTNYALALAAKNGW